MSSSNYEAAVRDPRNAVIRAQEDDELMSKFYAPSPSAPRQAPFDGVWQPIETAPKDGTEILGFKRWSALDGLPCMLIVKWLDAKHSDEQISDFHETWSHGAIEGLTHWMPLPGVPT
jgi:hypothetical protein